MDLGAVGSGLLGLAVLLFPGYAWVRALAPGLPAAKAVPLGVVIALTLTPMAVFGLNVLFQAPIRVDTVALLGMALGLAGVGVRASGRVFALVEA